MRHQHFARIFIFCLSFLGFAVTAQAEISLEASLSHLSFPVDEGAMLTITVSGAGRVSSIELPEIAGISFQNRGQSSRINVINGSMTSSLANNYLVQAEKPGIYTIPPIKVTAGSETAVSKPLSFEVTGSSQGSTGNSTSADRSGAETAFIRIDEIGDCYPGEIVPIRIKAYFNRKYRTDINSLPVLHGDGVVMPQLREKPTQIEEIVSGVAYHVLIWDTTLSGIKAGKHPLSFSMEASLLVPQRRRPTSPFGGGLFEEPNFNDPFFDSFFGTSQRKPIKVVSQEVNFNVIPLPLEKQPKNFNGAIGDFSLKVRSNRHELEVGEPLKLDIEISGSGNFDRVEAPTFPDGPEWKTYSPSASFASQGNSYTGTKTFEQAIVAKSGEVKEIPPLSFCYFDPAKKEYITTTSPPINVKIAQSGVAASPPPMPEPTTAASKTVPAAPPPASPTAPTESTNGFAQLAPLSLNLGDFHQHILPTFAKAWYLGLVGLCLLALCTLFFLHWRRQNLAQHPEKELRKKRNHSLALDRERIEQAYTAGQSSEFLMGARSAIQNQLGLLWNMPANAISLADLKARLEPASPLIEIFAAADGAAYGCIPLSREKMGSYLQILLKELEALS